MKKYKQMVSFTFLFCFQDNQQVETCHTRVASLLCSHSVLKMHIAELCAVQSPATLCTRFTIA